MYLGARLYSINFHMQVFYVTIREVSVWEMVCDTKVSYLIRTRGVYGIIRYLR